MGRIPEIKGKGVESQKRARIPENQGKMARNPDDIKDKGVESRANQGKKVINSEEIMGKG